jgi:hypothetical protein
MTEMTKIVKILSVPGGHSTKIFSVPLRKKCVTGTGAQSKIRPVTDIHGYDDCTTGRLRLIQTSCNTCGNQEKGCDG